MVPGLPLASSYHNILTEGRCVMNEARRAARGRGRQMAATVKKNENCTFLLERTSAAIVSAKRGFVEYRFKPVLIILAY